MPAKNLISFFSKKGMGKFLPAFFWFIVVIILLFLPAKDLPQGETWMDAIFFDKWVHAGIFAFLTFLFLLPIYVTEPNPLKRKGKVFFIIVTIILFGLASEFIQEWTGRDFDWWDWAADSTGVMIGTLFTRKFYKKIAANRIG